MTQAGTIQPATLRLPLPEDHGCIDLRVFVWLGMRSRGNGVLVCGPWLVPARQERA